MVTQADNELGIAIYQTLQYYALFRYPLQVHEIHSNCQATCSEDEIIDWLREQLALSRAYAYKGYYSLLPDVSELVERRLRGAKKADIELPYARQVGRLIYQFPFVKFVGISGSLSKGYSDTTTDYDFFIVTEKDRLWISRTLLHLFKKITFAFGQQHKFCMNYFIDESAYLLEERNIYTATEILSIIPVCGSVSFARFIQANLWVYELFPNRKKVVAQNPIVDKNSLIKRSISALISLAKPSALNKFFMKMTDTKWRKKWAVKGFPNEDYNLAFKTTLHISKNHPANYQKRILEALAVKDN